MRIAILDDNPVIGHLLQNMLELAGHNVSVHQKPATFYAVINQERRSAPLDLVIVDLCLSGPHSGAQVIHSLKMAFAELPVVLCTAADSATIEAAMKGLSGVKVLHKPFKIIDLLAVIQACTCAPGHGVLYAP